ncbi:MAG: 16S rRNA (cytosine(967)-C(5))-methyltransferase RsmB [Oscillibacter sp.]|jgi:16S rRNA (cytosine967-C5)-methyltransferase|nr:16S rRNA (cytosine(967)-C(5))-methyltransferase RsmB [Oscillibacter sp.]
MSGDARVTALRVLISVRERHAWADAGLKAQLARDGLSGPDAALATRLTYGVLQNQFLLDFWIDAFCTQKTAHLQPPLAEILRLGVYQIVFLDRIPDSAAVNESVNLARLFGRPKAAGLVNAVLRKASANKAALPEVPKDDPLRYLSIAYSHPKWLVKRLISLLGPGEAEAYLKADNGTVPTTVQINPLRTTEEQLCAELHAAGVDAAPHSWVPGCLELSGTGNLAELPAFREGRFFVQDAAAALTVLAARPESGMRVLDVCAAPGGKSFAAAAAMRDQGSVLSCDLYPGKLRLVEEGSARLGLTCIRTAQADAAKPRPDWAGSADLVLADVPCSGLGIIRKKPEIRYKRPGSLTALPVLQTEILDSAAESVRPGGVLLYSTCTILPEENQQLTDAFLARHPDFHREKFTLPQPVGETDGQITLWPHKNGTDGFYICRMRRA